MKGEFNLHKAREGMLEDYDILFIGMSKPELDGQMATRIRKEIGWDTKTKLVVCIDYAVELWHGTFNPYGLEQELMQADLIFVSEPAMLSHVKSLINERRPVHLIPHPSDVDKISSMFKPKALRTDEIVTIIHRYNNSWIPPFLATKDLPWNTWAVCLDPGLIVHIVAFFKYIIEGNELMQYLNWLSRKKVMLDSYHSLHTYGRNAVDCACLQIPCVGSSWQVAQNHLFPDLTVEPGDVLGQKKMIEKLMTDESFYDDCVEKASENVLFFNYENRRKDLLNKLYN